MQPSVELHAIETRSQIVHELVSGLRITATDGPATRV
jgi:hypothetical protein